MRGVIVLLAGLFAAAGPATAASGPALGRDTVVIEVFNEPANFNPLVSAPGLWSAYSALFTIDVELDHRTWRYFPQGVTALPSLADGTLSVEDGRMVLRWTIRPRRWHDGRRVACGDYVFTFKVAANPDVPVRDRDLSRRIAGVSCPRGENSLDVQVVWKEAYPYANTTVTGQRIVLPRHLLERYYQVNAARLPEAPFGVDPASTVGDGGYRLVEWQRGSHIAAEAVDRHEIFAPPSIRRIIWRLNPDAMDVSNILTGVVDVSLLTIDLWKAWRERPDPRYRIVIGPTLVWEHIDFNLDNPALRDIRVRRAIAHAINRRQILQDIQLGLGEVVPSYLPSSHPAYSARVQTYPYDPARARVLLEEAGYAIGADGVARDAAGKPLVLEFATTDAHLRRARTQEIVREQLGRIGIDVVIRRFPGRVFLREILPRRRFTGLAEYAWVWTVRTDCTGVYTSDGIPGEQNGWTGDNYTGYVSSEMDRLCRAASVELDERKRTGLLRESARLLARDLPALPLFYVPAIWAVKRDLAGPVLSLPGGSDETWNVHQWSWH